MLLKGCIYAHFWIYKSFWQKLRCNTNCCNLLHHVAEAATSAQLASTSLGTSQRPSHSQKMQAATICPLFSRFKSKFRGLLDPGFQDFTLCATNFDVRNLCIWRPCKDTKTNACHCLHWKCSTATTNRRAAKGLGPEVSSCFKKTREGFMQEVFGSFLRSTVSHTFCLCQVIFQTCGETRPFSNEVDYGRLVEVLYRSIASQ